MGVPVLAVGLLLACATASLTPLPRGNAGGFLDLDQLHAYLSQLSSEAGAAGLPLEVSVIGHSVEGRALPLVCTRIHTRDAYTTSSSTPSLLLTSLHHAREPLGMSVSLNLLHGLLQRCAEGHVPSLSLLQQRSLCVLPVVNPDAYNLNCEDVSGRGSSQGGVGTTTSHGHMARKNRRPTCPDGSYLDSGVDLNRNYDFEWAHDSEGSSPSPCAEDYRGPAPFSEPESASVARVMVGGNFTTALNWHSYGQVLNLPFGVRGMTPPPPVTDALLLLAQEYVRASRGVFTYGHPWENGLYSVNGETSDWMVQVHGVMAMSPELGPEFNFNPFEEGMWPKPEAQPDLIATGVAIGLEALHRTGALLEPCRESTSTTVTPCDSGHCLCVSTSTCNGGMRPTAGYLQVALIDATSNVTTSPSGVTRPFHELVEAFRVGSSVHADLNCLIDVCRAGGSSSTPTRSRGVVAPHRRTVQVGARAAAAAEALNASSREPFHTRLERLLPVDTPPSNACEGVDSNRGTDSTSTAGLRMSLVYLDSIPVASAVSRMALRVPVDLNSDGGAIAYLISSEDAGCSVTQFKSDGSSELLFRFMASACAPCALPRDDLWTSTCPAATASTPTAVPTPTVTATAPATTSRAAASLQSTSTPSPLPPVVDTPPVQVQVHETLGWPWASPTSTGLDGGTQGGILLAACLSAALLAALGTALMRRTAGGAGGVR